MSLVGQSFAGHWTTRGALGDRLGDWSYGRRTAGTRKAFRTHLRLYVLANATKTANVTCRLEYKVHYKIYLQYNNRRLIPPDSSVNVNANSWSATSACLQMELISTFDIESFMISLQFETECWVQTTHLKFDMTLKHDRSGAISFVFHTEWGGRDYTMR